MRRFGRIAVLSLSLILPPAAFAQPSGGVEFPAPAPVPEPEPEEAGALSPQPQVTIIRRRGEVIEEYRLRGRLYMIKVTPRKGYPYYLVDTDGDGDLETHRVELSEAMRLPSWILLRW